MLPSWASKKFKGWNHCSLMPELELLGLPWRFGTNCPVHEFFFCKQQHSYTGLGDVLSRLPLPTTVAQPWLSVHNAMEAGMLHSMDDEESLHFTAME
jgi:hypothetical protein